MTLHPEDAAELDRIRAARHEARRISPWETRVVLRALRRDPPALQREIAERLGVTQEMVHKAANRPLDGGVGDDVVP